MQTLVPHTVELAQFFNRRFAGWQEFGPFPSKDAAWAFITSHGYSAKEKGDKWMAYPAGEAA